jgi:hypothetical protein
MDFVQAKQDVLNWITGFVEQPNPGLQGWPPCPYARKARLDHQLDLQQGIVDPYTDLQKIDLGEFMVIGYIYDPKDFTADEFNRQVRELNTGFLLSRDIIALADHPNDHEEVNGVRMNQGTWAITFVQPLGKLNEFARLIAAKGYYDGWSEDYLAVLFEGREDPRK